MAQQAMTEPVDLCLWSCPQMPDLAIPDGEEAATHYNLVNTKVGLYCQRCAVLPLQLVVP